jgi:hypothetical protein
MEDDGCLGSLIWIILVVAIVIGIIKLIFEVVIPAILNALYLLFSSYKFSIFLAIIFMILFLINVQKIEEIVKPKKDSANNLLENQLQNLNNNK